MNTDIRISVEFWRHPKTVKLERRLGLEAVKSLTNLWMWTACNRPDGNLDGLDAEDVEIAAEWRGEPEALVKTLLTLRLLEWEDERYKIHDWIEHNPWASEAESRSDVARFSKLAQVNPAACEELRRLNISSLTPEAYQEWKSYYPTYRPATASEPYGERPATASEPYGNRPATASEPYSDRPATASDPYGNRPANASEPYGNRTATASDRSATASERSATASEPHSERPANASAALAPSPSPFPFLSPSLKDLKDTPPTPPGGMTAAAKISKNEKNEKNEKKAEEGEGEAVELSAKRFEEFWLVYPRKVGKEAARKAWKKVNPSMELFEEVLLAVERAKGSDQWQRDSGRFIPNPTTWLNQGRWEDELTPLSQPATTGFDPDGMTGFHNALSRHNTTDVDATDVDTTNVDTADVDATDVDATDVPATTTGFDPDGMTGFHNALNRHNTTNVDTTNVDTANADTTDADATEVDAADADTTDVDAADVDASDVDATDAHESRPTGGALKLLPTGEAMGVKGPRPLLAKPNGSRGEPLAGEAIGGPRPLSRGEPLATDAHESRPTGGALKSLPTGEAIGGPRPLGWTPWCG